MNVFVNNIEDKDALHTLVLKELRENGIKYQKTKKRQLGQNGSRRIFRIPLHQLELTDVFLVNGSIVQVPQFVSDACQRILEEVTTEGLFRKAGATARQKGIRALLENGQCLEKSHHVIDVANVLKSFFRELPEALLPRGNIQDAMLRCLFTEHKLNTLLLTCLLLPPLTLNLLTFFMQFLHTVALHSDQNRMTIQNLAIIFTPSLMPLPEMYPTRLENYVKIIEMLIENSDRIGIVPERFVKGHQTTEAATLKEEKKRKKRRSGSLTRVFNGLKKIVGVRGSADDLDKCVDVNPVTPCLTKSTKKRKAAEQVGMSAKKKKQIMALLPNGSLLPSTPMITKDNKKLRLSFGSSSSRRITKFPGVEPPETITESHIELPQMERRWSVVGTPIKNETTGEFDGDTTKYFSPVVSLPCLTFNPDASGHQDMGTSTEFASVQTTPEKTSMNVEEEEDKDYVKISKSEYQALNERVAAIEARISQEFSLPTAVATLPADAELVQDVYEQTLEETESLSPPATDELARRLSRDLKIRRSGEGRIFRSPSARKIGTIRRRSRESAARVTRTKSWHVGSNADRVKLAGDLPFYPPKGALKRGRPNTVQSGLRHPSPAATVRSGNQAEAAAAAEDHEMWTSAEEFFVGQPQMETDDEKIVFITEKKKEIPAFGDEEQRMVLRSAATAQADTEVTSPRFKTKIAVSGTPMLPPRGIPPKRTTPRPQKAFPKTPFEQQQQQLPPTGRASIARLRSQNAGMVAAKAKLFDGMSGEEGRTGRPPDVEDATPKRVGRCPRSQRLCDVDASRALRPVNADGGRTFLKPPVIKPAPLENTPRRLVKVPARLHSPNTPMRAFRANSRSPRVPRNYRSPRH
uniref:Putative rho gtpase-activating protein 11b n=1 Tax=Lutzomyia longipalpis TaxID=7200 RepID=A0A1B0CQF7_LUTLO